MFEYLNYSKSSLLSALISSSDDERTRFFLLRLVCREDFLRACDGVVCDFVWTDVRMGIDFGVAANGAV